MRPKRSAAPLNWGVVEDGYRVWLVGSLSGSDGLRYPRGTMRFRPLRYLALGMTLGLAGSLACQPEASESCTPAEEGCECNSGQCLPGLMCLSGLCVRPSTTATATDTSEETSGPSDTQSTTEMADSGSGPGADTGETGNDGCQGADGTIGCPCFAGNECLGDLTCNAEQTCICATGTACGESDCVEDFQTDNRHCGRCGNACTIVGTFGACEDGVCPPGLSDCVPAEEVTTCELVCQSQGRECVAEGCGPEFSWTQYPSELSCEENSIEGAGFDACTVDISASLIFDYVRCCCTP